LVKKIDKLTFPPLEKHVGANLWQMSELWKKRFDAEMVELGHSYFAEARSNILRYVGPNGVSQSTVVKRMGLSKQAVQQLIDDLVVDGVVTRKPDPGDKRGKLIVLTQLGLSALHDANKVKKRIEKEYEKMIGVERLANLVADLELLANQILKKG
jgi:DNA-binding MarR family transcriptional regulator